MKRIAFILMILMVASLGFAVAKKLTSGPGLNPPKVEIAQLEQELAAAKQAGLTPDPGLTARLRELVPQVAGHPGNVKPQGAENEAVYLDPSAPVQRPIELTPLEQQIKGLEFQMDGGFGGQEPDPVTIANLKSQLDALYEQRPVNRAHNSLDQGNDACPATVIPSVAYVDTGSTVGRANNYNPLISCNTSNAPDVIYSFTPTTTSTYTITTANSSYDTYLHVRTTGACPGTVQFACDDDGGPGTTSQIIATLFAGTTYFIIVDGFNTSSGVYFLQVTNDCAVTCQTTDVFECPEPIVPTHSIDDCNGACNNENGSPTWQDILPGQTICGREFTYVNHDGANWRDTDFYRFTLTEACSLRIFLESEVSTQILIGSAACPFSIFATYSHTFACSTVTFLTQCFQPGTYSLWVGPTIFTGIDEAREYRVRVDLVPCSGCRIDAVINAPGQGAWHTCVAGNDCSLRPSQDYNFLVNIPRESDWTFSLCNDDSIWDSYIYLTTNCCGGIIASDDDACGGVGLSTINCVHLQRGSYYLIVEGFDTPNCGPFTLHVTECLGSCCYGDPSNPVCSFINQHDCDSLSGVFTINEPCSTGACLTRPTCDPSSMFGQEPYLPDEVWNAYQSDYQTPYLEYDDYSTSGPIGSIKFWGISADDPTIPPCVEQPRAYEITFLDSIGGGHTQTYNVTLNGTPVPYAYGPYTVMEYHSNISPPCTITNGYVRIAGLVGPTCDFFWSLSPFGNHYSIFQSSGVKSVLLQDYAVCLSAPCEVDSVTMILNGPAVAAVNWWQSSPAVVTFWYTLNPNGVYPADFANGLQANYPAGHNVQLINGDLPFVYIILVADCSPAPALSMPNTNSILRLGNASK